MRIGEPGETAGRRGSGGAESFKAAPVDETKWFRIRTRELGSIKKETVRGSPGERRSQSERSEDEEVEEEKKKLVCRCFPPGAFAGLMAVEPWITIKVSPPVPGGT